MNAGRHLLALINDVLDLSKVEAGRMELYPETFAVAKAVEEVCAVVSPLARKKGITIIKDTDTRLAFWKVAGSQWPLLATAARRGRE